jgi:uncharacterized membrane protein
MKRAKLPLLAILIVLSLNTASATYISGDIFIYENGNAKFDIETDQPINLEDLVYNDNKLTGITSQLTNKKGDVWTFSIDLKQYENVLIDIHLPKNLNTITTIQGEGKIIDTENKIITIISQQEEFKVSYNLKNSTNYSWLIWPVLLIILITSYITYKKSRKRKEHLSHIMPLINEQEQKIIDILMKKPKRQKELRKQLGIPKASFSRYITNLEKKKLIVREGEGKNKILRLK